MTDLQSVVYGAVITRINSGITAYNTAVAANSLPGCQAASQCLDERANGKQAGKLAGQSPMDFAQIKLSLSGGNEQKTVTPTFGLAAGASCDAIVPIVIQLTLSIQYDPSVFQDQVETPLEGYINAGLKANYPKFGIAYCRGSTFNDTRRPEIKDNVSRTTFKRTMSIELWPHLAILQ